MATFALEITKALNEYKLMLRKTLPAQQHSNKIKELQLKRKQLKDAEDLTLYHAAQRVIRELERENQENENRASWYSGKEECLLHLKTLLSEYRVVKNRVLNVRNYAACALVEAIQLVSLTNKYDSPTAPRLAECCQIIAKYGDKKQQAQLTQLIQTHQEQNTKLFLELKQRLEKSYEKSPA